MRNFFGFFQLSYSLSWLHVSGLPEGFTPWRVPSPTLDPLLTSSEGPTLLSLPSSFFFHYTDHLICMCDSCLPDDAELTLTEHRCRKINSRCVSLGFQMLVFQMPSRGGPKSWQSQGSRLCPSLSWQLPIPAPFSFLQTWCGLECVLMKTCFPPTVLCTVRVKMDVLCSWLCCKSM